MTLEIDERDRLIRAIPDRYGKANRGQGCFKGKFGLEFVNSRKRITKPIVTVEGETRQATIVEALDMAAEGLAEHKGEGSPSSLRRWAPTRTTTRRRSSLAW